MRRTHLAPLRVASPDASDMGRACLSMRLAPSGESLIASAIHMYMCHALLALALPLKNRLSAPARRPAMCPLFSYDTRKHPRHGSRERDWARGGRAGDGSAHLGGCPCRASTVNSASAPHDSASPTGLLQLTRRSPPWLRLQGALRDTALPSALPARAGARRAEGGRHRDAAAMLPAQRAGARRGGGGEACEGGAAGGATEASVPVVLAHARSEAVYQRVAEALQRREDGGAGRQPRGRPSKGAPRAE
mmetsp:Transcript_14615/g.49157  ORF Transcript_14615/g.49157 Transcript_14615/m.49157 type:complete len:248 (-) Transcript_14615:885-1628(-)